MSYASSTCKLTCIRSAGTNTGSASAAVLCLQHTCLNATHTKQSCLQLISQVNNHCALNMAAYWMHCFKERPILCYAAFVMPQVHCECLMTQASTNANALLSKLIASCTHICNHVTCAAYAYASCMQLQAMMLWCCVTCCYCLPLCSNNMSVSCAACKHDAGGYAPRCYSIEHYNVLYAR